MSVLFLIAITSDVTMSLNGCRRSELKFPESMLWEKWVFINLILSVARSAIDPSLNVDGILEAPRRTLTPLTTSKTVDIFIYNRIQVVQIMVRRRLYQNRIRYLQQPVV